jgi:hypothetical protein
VTPGLEGVVRSGIEHTDADDAVQIEVDVRPVGSGHRRDAARFGDH